VDCPISILHLGFPSPDVDDASYDVAVQILVQSTNSLVVQTNQSIICKRRSVMRVTFEQPIRVEAGVMYKVVYKLKVRNITFMTFDNKIFFRARILTTVTRGQNDFQ
jgi:hypothetical protein